MVSHTASAATDLKRKTEKTGADLVSPRSFFAFDVVKITEKRSPGSRFNYQKRRGFGLMPGTKLSGLDLIIDRNAVIGIIV